MNLYLPDEHLNELQRRSIEHLIEAVRGMHYADVTIRKGGADHHFEADWLRHLQIVRPDR
jgi:hypothetical protein